VLTQGGVDTQERVEERTRLLQYYKHRYQTFISIMKDALRAKRVGSKNLERKGSEESKGDKKIFTPFNP